MLFSLVSCSILLYMEFKAVEIIRVKKESDAPSSKWFI